VAGLNEWKSSSALMDIGARKQTLYLDSKGTASPTAYRSGALGIRPPPDREPAYFIDDPLATHKTAAREKDRAADYHHPEWVIYQDNVLAIEEDGLVYHTEPFTEHSFGCQWMSKTLTSGSAFTKFSPMGEVSC
jgi:predicted acyl esterase